MSASAIDKIKRLYFKTTEATVERDLERAVTILKTLPDDATRARAAVYMDGLSQMRSEWRLKQQRQLRAASRSQTTSSRRKG
jgi:hypothetical protein